MKVNSLHENQKKILEYLLDCPEGATLDEIAIHLGVSKTAAKEHINKISFFGYLNFADAKGSIGRPRRRYLLSAEGQEFFPRQYSWLSTELLSLLSERLGNQKTREIMKALALRTASSLSDRFRNMRSSQELLVEIVKVMNELGYRTQLKQSDLRKGAILEASNCVYHSVAKKHPELCQFDIEFLKKTSGMNVQLETCIARGGSVCRFCLRRS